VDLSRNAIGVIQAVNNRSDDGFALEHEAMIQLLADQAGVAIQRYRLQAAADAARDLQREMNLARQVQQALIPKHAPEISGLTAVGWTKAASETGGDCFDLWRMSDGRLGVLVADATGHGLAPALVVSQTRTLVRGVCDLQPDPFDLLSCANARLAEDLRPGTFVTAFLAFISPDGLMHWSSAGHGPLFLRQTRDADFTELQPPAVPLGVVSEFNGDRVDPIQLDSGGLLAAISDGVLDARSPSNEILDPPRVLKTLNAHRADGPQVMLDALRQQLIGWQGKEEPVDDQTIVLIEKD
jgi:serine phosphatase RsbU (regulator of sigma subunit)